MLLHDYVDRWAAQRPDGEFAVQGERRTTWVQARDVSAGAACALRMAGLAPGDRCAVLARNAIEYLLLYVAASRAGVVLVPLNPRSTVAEWDQVVADAAAMLLVLGPGFAGALPAMPVVGGALPPVLAPIVQASLGSMAVGAMLSALGLLGVVCGLALPETRHRSLRGATIRPALAEG